MGVEMKPTKIAMLCGDVIQISPESDVRDEFKGKLALVDEVKGWGVVAFVQTFEGRAYIRLMWNQFEYIGAAPFLPSDMIKEAPDGVTGE